MSKRVRQYDAMQRLRELALESNAPLSTLRWHLLTSLDPETAKTLPSNTSMYKLIRRTRMKAAKEKAAKREANQAKPEASQAKHDTMREASQAKPGAARVAGQAIPSGARSLGEMKVKNETATL